MKSELDKLENIRKKLKKEFKIDLNKKIKFDLNFEKICSEVNTSKIRVMIDTNILTATSIDKSKLDEGWNDSGKTITFSEALKLLG